MGGFDDEERGKRGAELYSQACQSRMQKIASALEIESYCLFQNNTMTGLCLGQKIGFE
jgi:hypothetical protein